MSSVRRKPLPSESPQAVPQNVAEKPSIHETHDEKALPDVSRHERVEEKDLEAGGLPSSQPLPKGDHSGQDSTQVVGSPAHRKPSRESIQLATSARLASSSTFWQRFKRKSPSREKFFGLKRRTFFVLLGVVAVLLLALIIGLSVGLSRRHAK